jgi:hypothetical protein
MDMAFESSSGEMKLAYEKANSIVMPKVINSGHSINASRKLSLILISVNAGGHYGSHHGDPDERDLKNDVASDVSVPDYGPDVSALGFDLDFDFGDGDDGVGEKSCGPFHRGPGL